MTEQPNTAARTAQRYHDSGSWTRMAHGRCPECGETPEHHSNDPRFWVPRRCDLLPQGVRDRIEQYRRDHAAIGGGVLVE